MRVSTLAFLLGALLPAAGYLYLRRWVRALLAYGSVLACVVFLQMTNHLGSPQGLALLGLTLGTIYIYALIDAWQIGRRIDAQQLSARLHQPNTGSRPTPR